jgi:hypothetical protein
MYSTGTLRFSSCHYNSFIHSFIHSFTHWSYLCIRSFLAPRPLSAQTASVFVFGTVGAQSPKSRPPGQVKPSRAEPSHHPTSDDIRLTIRLTQHPHCIPPGPPATSSYFNAFLALALALALDLTRHPGNLFSPPRPASSHFTLAPVTADVSGNGERHGERKTALHCSSLQATWKGGGERDGARAAVCDWRTATARVRVPASS